MPVTPRRYHNSKLDAERVEHLPASALECSWRWGVTEKAATRWLEKREWLSVVRRGSLWFRRDDPRAHGRRAVA